MNVEELLYQIDEIVDEAKTFPLTGGKVVLDGKRVKEIVEDILCSLPEELKQARAIVADRNNILSKAKREAEAIVLKADEQANVMVARDEIVRRAQATSNEILSQAQAKSKDMRAAAGEFVDSLMKEADETVAQSVARLKDTRAQVLANLNEDFDLCMGELSENLTVIRKTRQNLRNPKQHMVQDIQHGQDAEEDTAE